MDAELLKELARHRAWADEEHWKALRGNAALLEDTEIPERLNHMLLACEMLQALPRGPKGPFEAPAGALLLQALLHSQHHRGQDAARMRALAATPPMTDYLIWCGLGRPKAVR
jgi:hypothetical protein